MLNKFEALRHFCTAAETLNFRETAVRLSVSPQVVTRMIAELEDELGESLFKRNSRNVRLTAFGEAFLPQAARLLDEAQKLFAPKRTHDDMVGLVRVTVPHLAEHRQILQDLMVALSDYPDIIIDWRVDPARLNTVEEQIDIGLRVGREPDPKWIVRPITEMYERIVAAPELVARLGPPESWEDLIARYPIPSKINRETGRAWGWHLNERQHVVPSRPAFISMDGYSELHAALAGRVCAFLLDGICGEALRDGRLQELLPGLERQSWKVYLYRPYHPLTPARVLLVFDLLTEIARKHIGQLATHTAADSTARASQNR